MTAVTIEQVKQSVQGRSCLGSGSEVAQA